MKRVSWIVVYVFILLLGLLMPIGADKGDGNVTGQVQAVFAPPMTERIDIWSDADGNYEPVIAYNSRHNEYLVVWWNDHGATRDIYARRITADGVLKSSFTVVSDANRWNWLPAVAYSPVQDRYLVVYTYNTTASEYDIYARFISWDGSVMSSEFQINTEVDKQWYPAIAYNSQNDEFLVVYENYWAGGLRDIAAQRVRAADGALLSWRNIATDPGTVRRLPAVAYNVTRNEYLIAYTYQYPTNGDIYGKVSSANMSTLSSEYHFVENTFNQDGAAVAAGPDEYLVVWEDGPSVDYRTIYGRRFSNVSGLQPLFAILNINNSVLLEPAVGYSPVYGYLSVMRYRYSAQDWDIYGRVVKPGQDIPWMDYSVIDEPAMRQKAPAVACDTRGDCLVAYEDDNNATNYNIRGRIVQAERVALPLVKRN